MILEVAYRKTPRFEKPTGGKFKNILSRRGDLPLESFPQPATFESCPSKDIPDSFREGSWTNFMFSFETTELGSRINAKSLS